MFFKKSVKKQDRSLQYFHAEAAASSVEESGSAYQAPSLVAAGAADKDVALLSSITNLIMSFIFLKVPSILESNRSIKRVMLVASFVSFLTWIPLIFVLFLFGKITPVWLIVLWITSLVPTLFMGPIRDNWLAEKLPVLNMGRYLSVRSVISALIYVSVFFTMGYVLDLSGSQVFKGYALILFVAFIASILSFVFYKKISPPKVEKTPARVYFGFSNFMREIKRGHMGKFILYVALINFSLHLCSAFFTVYMLRDLHFSYLYYAVIIAVEFIARIISLTFWGRLVDKTGSMRLLGIVSRFIPLIPVLWLFSSNIFYLIAIQFLSGCIWAAFNLCTQTFIYKGSPPDLRMHYIIYNRSLSTFAIATGALIGASILNYVFPVFGSQILGLFLISGIVRLIVVVGVFPGLNKQVKEETDLAAEKFGFAKRYLYKTVLPGGNIKFHHIVKPNVIRPVNKSRLQPVFTITSNPLQKGAFYHPEAWSEYSGRQNSPHSSAKIVPQGNGVYYRPGEWDDYIKMAIDRKPPKAIYHYDIVRLGLDKPAGSIRSKQPVGVS